MSGLAAMICLGICLASGFALGAETGLEAAGTAPPAARPELVSILADWASRASQVRSGKFQWRVLRQIRSPTFGVSSAAHDSAGTGSPPESVRTVFDERAFRLDGHCVPTVRLGDSATWLSIPASGSAEEDQFRAAMRARFARHVPVDESQTYALLFVPEREVQFWAAQGEAYPRGIVSAAGTNGRSLDGNPSATLEAGLLDALRLAVRPSFGASNVDLEVNLRVLPSRPVVEGRPCLVIEEPLDDCGESGSRRLWIDPSRGSLIVRYIVADSGGSVQWQHDVEYDRESEGIWLPAQVTVLRLNRFGDAHDEMSFIRESASLNVELPPETFSGDFPPGTWVCDHVAGEQYLVRADGTRRLLAFNEILAGTSYAELLSDGSPGSAVSLEERRLRNSVRQTLFKLITWPWILVTLAAIYAVWITGRAGFRRWRGRPRGGSRHGADRGQKTPGAYVSD